MPCCPKNSHVGLAEQRSTIGWNHAACPHSTEDHNFAENRMDNSDGNSEDAGYK